MRRHPKHDQMLQLIGDGLSDTAIGRELRADRHAVARVRQEAGHPKFSPPLPTLEEKWATFTRPVDGGHLEWTGERQSTSGTPIMRYREQSYTAARIAFTIRTGREPDGYARAECGMQHCVAPEHVDDTATRLRDREQLRYLTGGTERPAQCAHGHDQAEHGRYEADGRAYCEECKRVRRAAERRAVATCQPA